MDASSVPGASPDLDLSKWPNAQKLVDRCAEFFAEVEDLTPGKELEARLNAHYGPGTPYYDDFSALIRQGLGEGWVASTPVTGDAVPDDGSVHYSRGRICGPTAATRFFSITTVHMSCPRDGGTFAGQYHAHPYGEINCVILPSSSSNNNNNDDDDEDEKGAEGVEEDKAELEGMNGWQGPGWTSPGPGTHHYPRVRNGAVVALFFLPAGRISYKAVPGAPQPLSV